MAANTKIEWCDHTFNPWSGCTKVNAGCTNCYAEVNYSVKMRGVKWGPNGTRVLASESMWKQPLKWNREAERGSPEEPRPRVFCASLADVFEDWQGPIMAPGKQPLYLGKGGRASKGEADRMTMDDLRRDLFALIDATPNLDWLILTKRPENVRRMWRPTFAESPYAQRRENVWLLTSISDQATADAAIPHLLACRDLVPVLGVSYEPALGPVDFSQWIGYNPNHVINSQERSVRLRSGEVGNLGDNAGRNDLENSREISQEDCREAPPVKQISDGQSDAGRQASKRRPASAGVPAFRRADTAGPDDQSQGREHDEQSPEQSGNRDLRGASETREGDSRKEAEGSERRKKRYGETDSQGGSGDSPPPVCGGEPESDSAGFRSDRPADFQDSARATLDFIIVGGESGPHARPFDIAWARSTIEQCRAAGTACFVKQLGSNSIRKVYGGPAVLYGGIGVHQIAHEFRHKFRDPKGGDIDEWPADLRVREFPKVNQ